MRMRRLPAPSRINRARFERADHGVLFLDEIGELPLLLQARLLRVPEDGELRPLGAQSAKRIDAVVIAATSHDLRPEMLAGRVRRDLYYRLSNVALHVLPLRDRKEDIPLLAAASSVSSAIAWAAR